MRAGSLVLAATMLLPLAALAAPPSGTHPNSLAAARSGVETADYTLKGRLVRVDANGTRTSYGISIKARWFPRVLRVLIEVNSPAKARVHALLEMRPEGRSTVLLARPGDAKAFQVPFSEWTEGPAGKRFSFEDFLEAQYFWPEQKDLGEVKFGARQCDLLLSKPGTMDASHFSSVKSWLDHKSSFPVYVEKTLKGSGTVKEFTYFGLRRTDGVWSASQVEGKIRGDPGSTLFIISRGSAKAHLGLKDFNPAQLTHF